MDLTIIEMERIQRLPGKLIELSTSQISHRSTVGYNGNLFSLLQFIFGNKFPYIFSTFNGSLHTFYLGFEFIGPYFFLMLQKYLSPLFYRVNFSIKNLNSFCKCIFSSKLEQVYSIYSLIDFLNSQLIISSTHHISKISYLFISE